MDKIFIYIVIINLMTFLLYGLDKQKAKNHQWRIPEKTLLGMALVGGSIGALGGMKVFRHKTRKPKFYIGVPMILMVQVGIFLWIYR